MSRYFLKDMDDYILHDALTNFIRDEILWSKTKNRYGVIINKALLDETRIAKLRRRELANLFWETNEYIRKRFSDKIEEYNLYESQDKMLEKFLKLVAVELDYKIPIVFAQEYTGTRLSSVTDRYLVEQPNLYFRYKENRERFFNQVKLRMNDGEVD